MKASEFWPTLPTGPGPERDARILEAVRQGLYVPITWAVVAIDLGKYHAEIGLSSDAFRLGEFGDAWRIPVTPISAQQIADELSTNQGIPCVLPTAFLDDVAWNNAASRIAPHPMVFNDADRRLMATTAYSVQHSHWIDEQADAKGHQEGFLIRNVGKIWANTAQLWFRDDGAQRGANYGWHYAEQRPETNRAVTTFGGWTIQPLAFKHDTGHTDYSQTLTLVADAVVLTDRESGETGLVSLSSAALEKDLCGLFSHEGPLVMRHPAVGCIENQETGEHPPGCPVPWKIPGGAPAVAAIPTWKRVLPVAVAAVGIGVAAYLLRKG